MIALLTKGTVLKDMSLEDVYIHTCLSIIMHVLTKIHGHGGCPYTCITFHILFTEINAYDYGSCPYEDTTYYVHGTLLSINYSQKGMHIMVDVHRHTLLSIYY